MATTPTTRDNNPKLLERLNFQLPDFTRLSWVSDSARQTWQPRLQRITRAWLEIEWRSVAAGIRDCCLSSVTPEEFVAKAGTWAERGLMALPLQLQGLSQYSYSSTGVAAEPGKPIAFRIVIGKPETVVAFKRAFDTNDNCEIGRLLGFPACCQEFFQHVWVEQGCVDTTWQMAVNTRPPENRQIEVGSSPYANILWRWMGVRPVPHLPCSFDCQPTIEFGQQLVQLGRDEGFGEEMDWLMEILNWSVEWSALHGIAEIKTPVLKVSTRTDATPHKYTVRRTGETAPLEGARGLNFPYHTPVKPSITGSAAYQRGIENAIAPSPTLPDWYATDNGFTSRFAMDAAHRAIVELALRKLPEAGGNVLDLGCGNGALLEKLHTANPKLIPYGIEVDASRFEHISVLLPQFAEHFFPGDLFADERVWAAERRYTLALLMPGRLLEVEPDRSQWLRKRLQQYCDYLLVYAYGDWLTRYANLAGLAERAGLELLDSSPALECSLARLK